MIGARGDSGLDTAQALGQDLKILDGIASWCGGLHGSMPLSEALKSLAVGLGAEAAAIARQSRHEERCRPVAIYDQLRQQEEVRA